MRCSGYRVQNNLIWARWTSKTGSEAFTFIQVGDYLISSYKNLDLEGQYLSSSVLSFNNEAIRPHTYFSMPFQNF